jgi:hypothetical protein
MRIGLFGFPSTGKSTLFRLLTGAVPAHAGRGEAQIAVAKVPDPRLDRLSGMYRPKKTTPATVEYLDLPAMEKGQAEKVLPLTELRTTDALAHVVRAFPDETLPHSEGPIDPARDVATMETEFLLADHTVAERRLERIDALSKKTARPEDAHEADLFRRVVAALEREVPLRNAGFTPDEERVLRGYTFLSAKPLLVTVNAGEAEAAKLGLGPEAFGLAEVARHPRTAVVALSARIEAELAELAPADAATFMADLGIEEPALARMIRASYRLLGVVSFFTVGEDECRAWTIRAGTHARSAAGTIHSDIERGFIRAEVVAYPDLIAAGSLAACRERGTLRLEGKEYVVQDGDVVHFRFNV